jgi:hypothetical protein
MEKRSNSLLQRAAALLEEHRRWCDRTGADDSSASSYERLEVMIEQLCLEVQKEAMDDPQCARHGALICHDCCEEMLDGAATKRGW